MDDAMRWGPGEGKAAQLVVLLHGLGADGADLIDLAPSWSHALPHAAFVAPHAPEPYAEGGSGRQWFALWGRSDAERAAGAEVARAWLDRFIDSELLRLGVADYAIMGFSQGAMMALHVGLRRSVAPRAILAFSGALLAPERLAETRNHAPVLLVHGEADSVVAADLSRAAAAALTAHGIPTQTVFCPELGHGINEAGLSSGAIALQRGFSIS
jgi:phospholipase/carboxylesterase